MENSKGRILVIDDDALVLRTLSRLLEKNGYTVEMTNNGREGIEKAAVRRFDLIICDIRMPEIDGFATIRTIKENVELGKGVNCPVILLTGYVSEEAPIETIKLSVQDYILKPFDLNELLMSVRKCIS